MIGCGNAVGQSIPPMVIFEGKYLNHEWTVGEIPGTLYGMSDKGWTDQELFLFWLKHFLRYANPGRPLLLLLDGHSSHFELNSIELAKEEGVIIFCLPPHTTHRSQPLDSCVFGPLKKAWTEVCHTYQQDNPGAIISKYNFTPLFATAWLQSFSPNNLISGFRKCGIYPFNSEAIEILDDDIALAPQEVEQHDMSTSHRQPSVSLSHQQQSMSISHQQQPVSVSHQKQPLQEESQDDTPSHKQVAEQITEEMIAKFMQRYEEGYDLYDPIYQKWLEANNLVSTTSNSVTENFADVPVLNPILVTGVENNTSSVVSAASSIPARPSLPSNLPANENNNITSSYSNTVQKFMSPFASKPSRKSENRAVTTARVLTSKECLDIIKEKQLKKKAEEEEKQRRKKEREEKKKRLDEEKQKKAQQKAQKAAERAEKANKVAQQKARRSRTGSSASTKENVPPSVLTNSTSLLGKRAHSQRSNPRKPLLETTAEIDNDNQCCVCFDEYEEGETWVQCSCTRWLHEDCVIDVIMDSNGKPKICPVCLA